jgi:SAM-dependent methyltransferase
LGQRNSLSVASVGAGPLSGLEWLVSLAGPEGRVVALDLEPMHARPSSPRLHYVLGNLASLPLSSRSFDVIVALDVLEHLDDDETGLREAARVLRPGGVLLVTVPALPSLWGAQDIISHHRRRYTKETLYDAFARADLPRPDVAYFNMLLFPAVAGVRWFRRIRGLPANPRSDFEISRPGMINDVLAELFALERHFVCRLPTPIGSSLFAILRSQPAATIEQTERP